MKKLITGMLCATVMATAATGAASAHRMWLLPSTFTLSGDTQWITVDGAISNDLFFPNHVALPLEDIRVTAPDGQTVPLQNGATGQFRSTFDVELTQQGTYRISETGGLYFASWTDEEGETQRRRGTLETFEAEGITAIVGVSLMHSSRRVETFVTLGAPTTGAFELDGTGYELQPVTHPNDVYAGEAAEFRVFLNGSPAEGAVVEIVRGNDRYRDESGAVHAVTDADGSFSFTPDEPGRYWISAGRGEGARPEPDADGIVRISSYTATIEALPF